jgi:hypothetical protein
MIYTTTLTCNYRFKQAYGKLIKEYNFNPMLTVNEFNQQCIEKIRCDFLWNDEENIEIVEAGHSKIQTGKDPEEYNAIKLSNNVILNEFGKNNAFYFRKKNELV